jgi:two-component system phosphate regulon sensor histidine kinase PhoR
LIGGTVASYTLIPSKGVSPFEEETFALGLGSTVLRHNALWFLSVRWIITGILTLTAAISALLPDVVSSMGMIAPRLWLWILVVCVALANIAFWLVARQLTSDTPRGILALNLWAQIAVDLAAVTVVVHFVGSTNTFIPFIYLFHVVCACIFFSPTRSFLVTLIAAILYGTCVALEYHGILEPRTIMQTPSVQAASYHWMPFVYASSAMMVWFVVWFLVKTLSRTVIDRDRLLEKANKRLQLADEEKNKIVLRTTHDLKAPFSGIESNIQIMKLQCADELPERAKEILSRIERRCQALSVRIRDILVLGGIRSDHKREAVQEVVDIPEVIEEIKSELEDKANGKSVTMELTLIPAEILGNARHYSILLSNLIANAINYSHEQGCVKVSMHNTDTQIIVTVKDDGIGIAEDALPHIFDEYYRTSDAVTHNSRSTGLGLAIVQEIARKEGVEIRVQSDKGHGTQFDVAIPGDYRSLS